ncbi:MAG: isopentenyl-diphosphate Delta-isomerase [Cenarchaeum sp. SB0665_bin_23]|nr:isopentenyl-diphosphate Delta-isomerase [Cenarchaeum sp. SB0667_bin_13]MXY37699.1 isopentenyl-diphosphate Delta-isomerase [Cenarchaeum sp. SB0664_bin_35]MXY61270.1 isopentenyl-diphosphate Delta-isomerase [Cenarchaeum sp. SB0665_bin_23]MXZ93691.1 isopentenyl-diphosphate Delta-isomerase [Cenarchaeum sp. SB0666_bin_15]MYB47568.1 isopentenyl-diphosphate Delta-isomerase [Cenarchaeum sp. SB0662_bin_33]MYC79030.1 isopentenyl-diphosphate Delta-isomerase [Cenarchaeum sp. SB0661_bin_35]MYD59311.1 is
MSKLILVDGNDTPLGFAEKVACHTGNGRLHRAFTALLFDEMGRLLLTRRSPTKMLWPNKWDGTVASHPYAGDTFVSSAQRRIPEELGVHCSLDYIFKFEYHVSDGERGSENEICGTLIGTIHDTPNPAPSEISKTQFVLPSQIDTSKPQEYCPWMLLALALLPRHTIPGQYDISVWQSPTTASTLLRMAGHHMSDEQWRLV